MFDDLTKQNLEEIYKDLISNNRHEQVIVVNEFADKVIKKKAIKSDKVVTDETSIEGVNRLAGYDYFVESGIENETKCVIINRALYNTLRSLPKGVNFWVTIESMNNTE